MTTKRILLTCIAAIAAAIGVAPATAAGEFPDHRITLVVPFAAGGATDLVGRVVARALEKAGGQPVVVENVGGAGATLGTARVAAAPADGYTVLLGSSGALVIAPHIYKNLRYDPLTSFAPIGKIAQSGYVVMTRAGSGLDTYEKLVAAGQAKPSKLNFGSPGVGSSLHLTIELMMDGSHFAATHVPFSGTAPAYTALMGGHIDFLIDSPSGAMPMVAGGKVIPLVVTSRQRVPEFPDLPTLQEKGLANFETLAWFALLAPKGTPAPVVTRLQQLLATALKDPEVKATFAQNGFQPSSETTSTLAETIRNEYKSWGATIEAHGVKLDN